MKSALVMEENAAMTCHLWSPDRRTSVTRTVALPLCLVLSACGGGGGGDTHVAGIPPPPATPTPTPTVSLPTGTTIYQYPATNPVHVETSWIESPATRSGTNDLMGRLLLTPANGGSSSTRTIGPREFTIGAAQPWAQQNAFGNLNFQYTLTPPAGFLPAGLTSVAASIEISSWDINDAIAYHYATNPYGDTPQYFGQRLVGATATGSQLFSYDFTRGSAITQTSLGSGNSLRSTLDYDTGYSYVAMGEWAWRVVDLTGAAAGDFGNLLFVNGDRTPSTGIPVSGNATYDARSLMLWSDSGVSGIPFTLTANFDQRTMSTRIDQNYRYTSSVDEPILGIHVGGTAPFGNSGLFDIPLAGTANYSSTNTPVTPPSEPVAGVMNGAFFGPHAEQVGGTFHLDRPGGTLVVQDAFVGQQKPR